MSTAVGDAFEIGLANREAEFGKRWTSFLARLTVPRIHRAGGILASRLQTERLDGKGFLDIGSGGGLMSLAARRRGARVMSFDSDPQAVACARELRRRYFPDDPDWQIEVGSVLDRAFLKTLEPYDFVYADNVLNQTGAMRQAFENIKPLVAFGGQLHVSIYNDYQEVSDRWDRLKRTYKKLPQPISFLFGLGLIMRSEARLFLAHRQQGSVRHWLRSWSEEDFYSGNSRWRDWIEWLDAYPYERASVEEIVELFRSDEFRLISVSSPRSILDCVHFVFHRDPPVGLPADQYALRVRARPPRQLNPDVVFRRITAPWALGDAGWTGTIPDVSEFEPDSHFALFRDEVLIGPTSLEGRQALVGSPEDSLTAISQADFYVVAGEARSLFPPFHRVRGWMWSTSVADLAPLSDDIEHSFRSPVSLFEDGHQLRKPHTAHEEIAQRGGGHFSHWEHTIYFSTGDGSDPNFNGKRYSIFIGGRCKRSEPIPSTPDTEEKVEDITPEMISAGVAVLDDWDRLRKREDEESAPSHSGVSKVDLVTALYRAMRARV